LFFMARTAIQTHRGDPPSQRKKGKKTLKGGQTAGEGKEPQILICISRGKREGNVRPVTSRGGVGGGGESPWISKQKKGMQEKEKKRGASEKGYVPIKETSKNKVDARKNFITLKGKNDPRSRSAPHELRG